MARPPTGPNPARARSAGGASRAGAADRAVDHGSSGELRAVGPGRPGSVLDLGPGKPLETGVDPRPRRGSNAPVSELDVFGFPVQIGKVQPPLLPAETLDRGRLLDWMSAKIHSRLVLIVADAGYGKTTLLADWSRRTRVRVLWYRLDEADRDWVVFVNHIVAAGREIDPEFAPNTMSLIRELGAGMGDRASIVRSLLAEVRKWVAGGTALLLDDYHIVDDAPDVREIVRELVLRGPERLAVVISTRRTPTLPLARLRALGEVSELTTADLRFDRTEMERLFRDAYRHPLDDDLLDDLARTTEGWAATLRLVETAVRGRPGNEVRAVIRSLSARHGDLHDYLAEEVVGRMPIELQDFLERCSLLQVATPQLAAVAADVSIPDARRLLDITEEAGLLSRRGRTGQAGRLLHPLVRSFLEGRLMEAVGTDGISDIHARIAVAAEHNSWWLASHHYAAAGRSDDVARVLSGSLEAILGSGGAQAAVELMTAGGGDSNEAWRQVLVARRYLDEARFVDGARVASLAWTRYGGDESVDAEWILVTLIASCFAQGDYAGGASWARRLADGPASPLSLAIARAVISLSDSTVDGPLDVTANLVHDTARLASSLGHQHFYGISMLNLAWVDRYRGLAIPVEAHARAAEQALSGTAAGPELTTVHSVLAWSLAHQGRSAEARQQLAVAMATARDSTRFEMLVEVADIVGGYFDPDEEVELLTSAASSTPNSDADQALYALTRAEAEVRCGRVEDARRSVLGAPDRIIAGHPAFSARRALASLLIALVAGDGVAAADVRAARERARLQRAESVLRGFELLDGALAGPESLSLAVRVVADVDRPSLSVYAELLTPRLASLDDRAYLLVGEEARARPTRWRASLRREIKLDDPNAALRAAELLEAVGDARDILLLRQLSKALRGSTHRPDLGRALARRIAPRIWVEDQGRVVIKVGDLEIPGTAVRRKALALLCFLLTRPGLCASRDQVLDALWPDQDPDQSANSLHQSVYFLRRVFEPSYSADLSPGYLNHDPELLWLDPELVDSRSNLCRRLLDTARGAPEPALADALSREYISPFALDFAYEEWASPFRENLHARYLEVLERAIQADVGAGHVDRAIQLSRSLLDVDPSADEVERTLLHLYQAAGAHRAAAEQYAHYADVLRRDLGVEPPDLQDI